MIAVVLSIALGAAFVAIGQWGRRNAPVLVPSSLGESSRHARERSLRRGARTCLITGGLFVAFAVLQAVDLVIEWR